MSKDQPSSARRSAAARTKKTRAGSKSAARSDERHVCLVPGCGKVCRTAAGLKSHQRQAHPPAPVESPTVAVERALSSIEITPRVAVLAATVRELAAALEKCDPSDKAKTSKELTARMVDIFAVGSGSEPEADDWGDLE